MVADRHPEVFLSVSATTRAPRPGEVDGLNYQFVSREEFEAAARVGQMLEWAEYQSNLYGTPRQPVEDALGMGRPALLEIDLAGARQVRDAMPGALQVFLVPPSFADLRRRLEDRGTEADAQVAGRLARAEAELAAADEFDFVLVNDQLDRTVVELARLMGLK
jgi:guanylate kinase